MKPGYNTRPRWERNEVGGSAPFGRRGFTLIEMLVVMGVIAILLSILAPAVQSVRYRARRAQCGNQIRQLCFALRFYADDNRSGRLPTTVADTQYRDSFLPLNIYVGFQEYPKMHNRSIFTSLKPYVKDVEVYYCPNIPSKPSYRHEAFDNAEKPGRDPSAKTGPFCFANNYPGILETERGEQDFRCPRKIDGGLDQSNILVFDTVNYGNWRNPDGFISSEPIKNAGILGRTTNTFDIWWIPGAGNGTKLQDKAKGLRGWMQIGYTTGVVESVPIGETKMLPMKVKRPGSSNPKGHFGWFFMPEKSVNSR